MTARTTATAAAMAPIIRPAPPFSGSGGIAASANAKDTAGRTSRSASAKELRFFIYFFLFE